MWLPISVLARLQNLAENALDPTSWIPPLTPKPENPQPETLKLSHAARASLLTTSSWTGRSLL